MRILLDSRMIRISGIGRYIYMLTATMLTDYPQLQVVLAGFSIHNQEFIGQLGEVQQKQIETAVFEAPIFSIAERLKGMQVINKHRDVDLVHIPHFNAPWNLPANSVVTVHDLIPFKLKRMGPRNPLKHRAGKIVLENSLKKAGRIITVSQATARDLLQSYPDPALQEKIRIIPLGVSPEFFPLPHQEIKAFKARHHLQHYLLFVGNRSPHKNLKRLLKAYAMLLEKYPALQLVIAGKRTVLPDEVDMVKKQLGLNMVREYENCSDKDLHSLYCGAEMLVFPSLYEGFGLPPLEAMACGTAVVVSNTTSLPEVVGDAGLYVNPLQTADIAEKVDMLLSDPTLRNRLQAQGCQRAAMFSWHNTARATMAVYQEILKG